MALFLDDLQWMDAASLELLEYLVTNSETQHLLLVGAYRDNEVGAAHPLMRTLEAIRKAGARVEQIALAPLGIDDVGRLVADALHCVADSSHPLAKLVHEKTGGNPFFAIQFLTALAEQGLLSRDPDAGAWIWDLAGIRAHGYTDNVVDLMVDKLKRLSGTAQTAMQQLACLGNVVEIASLSLVFGESVETIHRSLLEAVGIGLILRLEGSYAFLHDRIQEAAYALIPEDERAGAHLGIGRVLLASMSQDQLTEHLFDVANQLNRGAALLIDREEKAKVAAVDLRAGRKAKASAAYASAREYFSAGMALVDDGDWSSQYELTFSLWLERAECELSGSFENIEHLIAELLQRGRSKVDRAAAYRVKIQLHILKGEYPQAVANALACLMLFGIDIPEHPTREQVQAEYETVWPVLNGRPIESLIDLPLMTDPELLAATNILSVLAPAASYNDYLSFSLIACRLAKIGIQHGVSGTFVGFSHFGTVLGPVFHRYVDGHRFARLGCDLVEKHSFTATRAKVYISMGSVGWWTQPVAGTIDLMRAAVRAAIDTGDLTVACFSMTLSVTYLLLRNDPLEAVWRESEMALDFALKAKSGHMVDVIRYQQRFIANMLGRTVSFSSFSDAQFDETAFEAQMRMPELSFGYWKYKLMARYMSGDYVEALTAASKAKPLLSSGPAHANPLDYFYFSALTVATLYEKASADEQQEWRDLLTAHREQLREWAENYPPTFADKHLLVSAEIARIEGRAFDAMQLYEQAIRSAHENGFVQNEGVAHEVAARFYLARGFETIAYEYLCNARNCYDRWGALGKVKQLDERYPHLHEERLPTSTISTIGTPVRQLDVETVVKASQALSSEIVLPRLIERLMRIAVQHAGAERGLLILLRDGKPQIEAAAISHGTVEVSVRQTVIAPLDLPQSVLHYVFRTRERVVLDDASVRNLYSEDEYVRAKRPRSVLCLPVINQMKLIGALYLENNLTPRAFTSDRIAVLEMLASQAAISLENASLYAGLQRSEAYLAQGQSISHTGSFGWSVVSGEIYWSEETYRIFARDRAVKPTLELIFQRIHPDDRELVQQALNHAIHEKIDFEFEHRLLMPDGSCKHLHVIGHASKGSSGDLEFVGAVTDVSAAKQAEEKIRQSETEFRQILDFAPQQVAVLGSDGSRIYANQAGLDYYGLTLEEWRSVEPGRYVHPEDRERFGNEARSIFLGGVPHETEVRSLGKDGKYRWFLYRWNPLRDEQGRLIRWYIAATDIEDRKQAEQRLQNENVALREEIDRASMFEEIVGTSRSLQTVLSLVSKVAPTDSSVLVTGETGTGKELVARAIHKRSRRCSRPFVSVNCAAIPRDLIGSELFGHEKGAFTGAIQRRIGRFELAEGGTIFLDEIGELPAETQIALLRVLQEHEFERVGGAGSIRTNVRVIAATNRDLEAAIAAGVFRSDLYYRLNVFPVEMPPLRDRREDIPLLVEYFIDRFARKAGKRFQTVNKKSLALLESYPWPGNIRELQNVIERSVIVCEAENFSVDESWLSRQTPATGPSVELGLARKLSSSQEKAIIEAALIECQGQVSGPTGAAAKLGIPGSTLESKIKSLKIDKNRFKSPHLSTTGN